MSEEDTPRNLVDSSGWMEYFADGENADFFASAIEDHSNLLVPVICIYEVFKKVMQSHGRAAAEFRIADMVHGQVVEITASLAISAAILSSDQKLPMADSLILAVAREHEALLWTQDEHFEGMKDIQFVRKK